MPAPPDRVFRSHDGTPIAAFRSGEGPSVVLVHGAAADHTTWRAAGPALARRRTVWAIDRRGRGASGDTTPYAVGREFEDVAAVTDALASEAGGGVPVVGHSFGGRVALGAALQGGSIARVVAYEGAPAPPGAGYGAPGLAARLAALPPAELLETFLVEVVGLDADDIAAYRANPVWPDRVAAAPTIVRELEAEASVEAGLDALGAVSVPVLLLLGSASRAPFHAATDALAGRLARGQVEVIEGARHAAHHTHVERFVAGVESFLDGT